MAKRKKDVMIIDYDKCIRVPPEDATAARESTPYRCPSCARLGHNLTPQSNSGKLRFVGDRVPLCEDHSPALEMEPVNAT
jgi:hypothetical protein